MKTGLTLTELAAELERQRDAKDDFVVDTRELTMLTTGNPGTTYSELHLPGDAGEFEVERLCHRQIGDKLGIPAKFYDRLQNGHPALLDHNVNTLLREAPERRMVRTFDWTKVDGDGGDKIARAYLSDRYRRLDNDELAEAILPVLHEIPDVTIMSCDITDRRMYIKAVAPRLEADVKVGDTVQAGVVISNSEVGWGALSVQPLIFRLICRNGMIVAEATRRYHVGRQVDSEDTLRVLRDETVRKDDEAFFSKIADVTRAAVDETRFQAIVAQMREAGTGETIQQPLEAMERLQKKYDLADGEKESVLKHLVTGGDLSAYGALNAVTRASQDVESYDRATELEEVGGKILAMAGTKDWATIAA